MRVDLKLTQKGLLLISVPLAFELLFVAILAVLQLRAEKISAEAAQSRDLVLQTDTALRICYESGADVITYAMTKSGALLNETERTKKLLSDLIAGLKTLVSDNPIQLRNVRAFEQHELLFLRLLSAIERSATHGDEKAILWRSLSLRNKLGNCFTELMRDTIEIAKEEQIGRQFNSTDEAQTRTVIKVWLAIGVAINVLVSILLAVFFSKDITRRVSTIVENAQRLSADAPLKQLMSGNDEIAFLDRVFHEMAAGLKEAADKERALINNAVDVICSLSEHGKFLSVSSACERVWGYKPDELLGTSIVEYLEPTYKKPTLEQLSTVESADNATIILENQFTRKDKVVVDLLWSAYWSRSAKAFFCVAHDISERKHIDRLKRDFVNMVSHDLRTPLFSTQAILEMIGHGSFGELSQAGKTYVSKADGALSQLVALVDNLLNLEKMDAGKIELTLAPASVGPIIGKAIDMVHGFADKKSVSIEVSQTSESTVLADSDRLMQVVQNFLSNAIKFSPKGSTVVITSIDVDDCVEVQVTDQGIGIPTADQEIVFDRFRTSKTGGSQSGTGLGLAICKALILQHGGEIGVRSQQDKGSTFWFRLPIQSAK